MENLPEKSVAMRLSEAIESINKPEGRARLQAYLESRPFPRFWAHPDSARWYIREEADGTRIAGRFEKGKWVPLSFENAEESAGNS